MTPAIGRHGFSTLARRALTTSPSRGVCSFLLRLPRLCQVRKPRAEASSTPPRKVMRMPWEIVNNPIDTPLRENQAGDCTFGAYASGHARATNRTTHVIARED